VSWGFPTVSRRGWLASWGCPAAIRTGCTVERAGDVIQQAGVERAGKCTESRRGIRASWVCCTASRRGCRGSWDIVQQSGEAVE